MMDRRELLYRASMILGGALSSSAAAGILAGCTATPAGTDGAQTFLSADEMRTVTAMADQIIPRTDTPGALDPNLSALNGGFVWFDNNGNGTIQTTGSGAEVYAPPFRANAYSAPSLKAPSAMA